MKRWMRRKLRSMRRRRGDREISERMIKRSRRQRSGGMKRLRRA